MNLVRLSVLIAAAVALASPVQAQDWPNRPVRMMIGAGPGGGTDIIARLVADPLAKHLGQPVVIENKPGAGTTLASELVAKSAPDGYSAVLMSAGHAVAAAIYKTLRYDSVADFQPASLVAEIPLVLIVRNDSPIKDIKTLIERARAKPDELSYGTGGVGTTMHLSAELLQQIEGIKLRHIPHRTAPQLVQALEAGDVDVVFETMPAVLGQLQAGTRRALAVTTRQRFPGLPNVPTLLESGVRDFDVSSWYAVAFPAKTPMAIADKMSAAVAATVKDPDVAKRALDIAFVVRSANPIDTQKHLESEVKRWRQVVEARGVPQQ
jgi:tripartite-type tricarboxylate transporter receptor subunit TctC